MISPKRVSNLGRLTARQKFVAACLEHAKKVVWQFNKSKLKVITFEKSEEKKTKKAILTYSGDLQSNMKQSFLCHTLKDKIVASVLGAQVTRIFAEKMAPIDPKYEKAI